MAYVRTAQNHKCLKFSCVCNVFILFYERRWQGGEFKIIKNYHNLNNFSRFGSYHQVFGQVKEWLIVAFCEMIKVPHVIAYPKDFNLLCDRDQQGGVLKPMENDHFQVFLSV